MLARIPARQPCVVATARLADHETGGEQAGVRVGERERDPLVHADRAPEDLALAGVGDRLGEGGAPDAERF